MAGEPLWLSDRARRKFAIRVNGVFPSSLGARAFQASGVMAPPARKGLASQGIQPICLVSDGETETGGDHRTCPSHRATRQSFPPGGWGVSW